MRHLPFILLCIVFLNLSVFASYERTLVQLPIIGESIARLDKATGWMQSPSGEWIERENRIVKYLSNDYKTLLDYESYGLGVDNFNWIELREVEIQGNEYYLLLKACCGGQYRYPSIKKGWSKNYQVSGYVFNKEDWKIEFIDRKPYLLRLKLLCQAGLVYYEEPTEEQYIQDMKQKLNEKLKQDPGKFTRYLNLNTMYINDSIRFLFIEESLYISGSYKSTTYLGLFELSDLPIDIKETVTPKVFEKFYYETDFKAFSKLFPQ